MAVASGCCKINPTETRGADQEAGVRRNPPLAPHLFDRKVFLSFPAQRFFQIRNAAISSSHEPGAVQRHGEAYQVARFNFKLFQYLLRQPDVTVFICYDVTHDHPLFRQQSRCLHRWRGYFSKEQLANLLARLSKVNIVEQPRA